MSACPDCGHVLNGRPRTRCAWAEWCHIESADESSSSSSDREFDIPLDAVLAEGRVLYVLTSGDRPWLDGFQLRFESWLTKHPRGARQAMRKRQKQSKLKPNERLTASVDLAKRLVGSWKDFGRYDPNCLNADLSEAKFLADAVLADYRDKNPVRPTCDFHKPKAGEFPELIEVRPDAYSTSVRLICEACFANSGRAQFERVSPAVALLVEVSAIETAEIIDVLEANGNGYSVKNGRQVPLDIAKESLAELGRDGWDGVHSAKVASNGMPLGAPTQGATNVPGVLAKIEPQPVYSIEKYRAVAGMRGPAVNGDGPIRDDLDRLAFEYWKTHGGNVAAFALFFGIERKHVYARADRHARRSETEAA